MMGTACPSLSDALPYSTGCPASAEEWVFYSPPASEEGLYCPLGQPGSWDTPGREGGTFSGLDLPPETCRGTCIQFTQWATREMLLQLCNAILLSKYKNDAKCN